MELIQIRPGFGGFDEPYEKARVVFMGAPLDVTSSYRAGTRFAPARIREASMNLETYLMGPGLDVFERLGISDVGDLILSQTDLRANGERITRAVQKIASDGKLPAVLGGEHTTTLFALRAFRDVFLIQLDAHLDLRQEYMGDKICHATVTRRILEFLPADRIAQVGVRSCSKEEAEFLAQAKIRVYPPELVMKNLPSVVDDLHKVVGGARVYLSIDLDVLDPAFAPGVSTPEPGGPSTTDILELLRELGKFNLCAFDVVELTPPYDDGTTALVAAKMIYELLAAMASLSE